MNSRETGSSTAWIKPHCLLVRTKKARDHFYYFCKNALHGARKGKWKLLLPNRKNYYNYVKDRGSNEMELYNLESDIGERRNLARQNPEIVSEMLELIKAFQWPTKLPDTNITPRKKKGM